MEVKLIVKYLGETHQVSVKVSEEVLENMDISEIEQYLLAKVVLVVQSAIQNALTEDEGGLHIGLF